MHPDKFDIILWDFDGVIINSNDIREEGFRKVLSQYPNDKVEDLLMFHRFNGGLSRYVKFKYFYSEILNESYEDSDIVNLSREFSDIMKKKLVNRELLIEKTISFIKEMHSLGKIMYIVSGSDELELNQLCYDLGISEYFREIKGSPKAKIRLVREVMDSRTQRVESYCLIGDSINDLEAAEVNGIVFFGYNNVALKSKGNYIDSFDY